MSGYNWLSVLSPHPDEYRASSRFVSIGSFAQLHSRQVAFLATTRYFLRRIGKGMQYNVVDLALSERFYTRLLPAMLRSICRTFNELSELLNTCPVAYSRQ